MRCAPVAAHRSLAVIRLDRSRAPLEPALAGCLREIAGVSQVHNDRDGKEGGQDHGEAE
jgi:hypothetical protein